MKKSGFDILRLGIDANASSLPWIEAMSQLLRAEQIQAEFPPHLRVREAGFGKRTRSESGELVELHIKFTFKNLEETCAVFERVGRELGFPPGSCLTHVTKNPQGEYKFTDLLKW